MKHIIKLLAIASIFMSCTLSANEKSDAEKYIAEQYKCSSVTITEFGGIQKFPYATRRVLAWYVSIEEETSYVAKNMVNAFYAKNVKGAINLLKECKDSTERFKMEMPSSTTLDNLSFVAKDPELYLDVDLNDDFFEMMNARKVTFILPNGYVKTDIVIYNNDGKIRGLGSTFSESVINFFKSCTHFYNECRELNTDLRDWKNGEYSVN